MDEATLRALLDDLAAGRISADDAVARLRRLPFADVGDALVDHHRALRQGMPEAVYGPGKTPEQCVRIVGELLAHGDGPVLLTRASDDQVKAVDAAARPGRAAGRLPALPRARAAHATRRVLVVTAGTADRPGRRRVRAHAARLRVRRPTASTTSASPACTACSPTSTTCTAADAVVVVAGMEGALASVVGGLTGAPVVAVPTSVGYGAVARRASRRCWRCTPRAPAA